MRKIFVLFLGLFMLVCAPMVINAEDEYFQEGGKERVVDHSLFTANQVVESRDTVNGLNFVAGDSISITGKNEYGIFAGNNVVVSNEIEKDLFAAGNNISIRSESKLGRDIYVAGSNITINANVEKNAFVAGNVITLKDTTIKGNIKVACQKLVIEGVVTISGTLSINNDAIIDNESNLMVDTKEVYDSKEVNTSIRVSNVFVDVLISIACLLIVGFAINGMFPKTYEKIVKNITVKNELKNMLLGLIAIIIIPIVSIILICTMIGILLGFVTLLVYILMLLVALLYGSVVVGNLILTKLFKAKDNSYLAITIGVILIKLLGLIPSVGGYVYLIAILYGMGKPIELFKNRVK